MELNIVAPAARKSSHKSKHRHKSDSRHKSSSGHKHRHANGSTHRGASTDESRHNASGKPGDTRKRGRDGAGGKPAGHKRPRTGDAGDAAAPPPAPAAGNGGKGSRRKPVRLEPQRVPMVVQVPGAAPLDAGAGTAGGEASAAPARATAVPALASMPLPSHSHTAGSIFRGGGTFTDLGIGSQLNLQLTDHMRLKRPTQCQVMAVPLGLTGQDVILKSETGSGKTLAFLLPIVHQLLALPQRCSRADGTRVIILAPTRELCQQTSRVLSELIAPFRWIVAGSITGGEKKKSEKARLRKGVTILVCTPGRLLDHLQNTECFNVSPLQFLVLDEADRLLDLGFEQQVASILEAIDAKARPTPAAPGGSTASARRRQTYLISATMSAHVRRLAGLSMTNPVFIDADGSVSKSMPANADNTTHGGMDDDPDSHDAGAQAPAAATMPERLVQRYMVVPAKWRLVTLLAMLRRSFAGQSTAKIVVFFSSCASVDFHYAVFQRLLGCISGKTQKYDPEPDAASSPLLRLHGNVPQVERTSAFRSFCDAKRAVLFATDVAARGLDLPVVSWIMQMDPPCETSDYVHRVGRTARGGESGSAMLFLLPSEVEFLQTLGQHQLALSPVSNASVLTALRDAVPPLKAMLEATADDPNRSSRRAVQLQRFAQKMRKGKGGKGGRGGRPKWTKSAGEVERELEMAAVRWQVYMEELVSTNDELSRLAREGFQGYIRSYATHSKDTKHIFHVRALHFGHAAKSFALREQPKLASSRSRQANDKGDGKKEWKGKAGAGGGKAKAKQGGRGAAARGAVGVGGAAPPTSAPAAKGGSRRRDQERSGSSKAAAGAGGGSSSSGAGGAGGRGFKGPSMQQLSLSEFDA